MLGDSSWRSSISSLLLLLWSAWYYHLPPPRTFAGTTLQVASCHHGNAFLAAPARRTLPVPSSIWRANVVPRLQVNTWNVVVDQCHLQNANTIKGATLGVLKVNVARLVMDNISTVVVLALMKNRRIMAVFGILFPPPVMMTIDDHAWILRNLDGQETISGWLMSWAMLWERYDESMICQNVNRTIDCKASVYIYRKKDIVKSPYINYI